LKGHFATNCRSEWIAAVEDGPPGAGLTIWEDSNGSAETIDSETRDGGLAFVREPADCSDLVVVVDELDGLGGQCDEHDTTKPESWMIAVDWFRFGVCDRWGDYALLGAVAFVLKRSIDLEKR